MKVEMIECAHHGIPRRRELEDHETRSAIEHAIYFAQGSIEIVYVSNAESDDRAASAIRSKGEVQGIGDDRGNGLRDLFAAGPKHWLGEIGAQYAPAEAWLFGEQRGDVECPRTEIEVRCRWCNLPVQR